MFQQRGDRAIAQQLFLQRIGIARSGDDVTTRENPSVGMNDESAARSTRAGFHHPGTRSVAARKSDVLGNGIERARRIVKLRSGVGADTHDRRLHRVRHLLHVIEPRHVPPAGDSGNHDEQKEAPGVGSHLG